MGLPPGMKLPFKDLMSALSDLIDLFATSLGPGLPEDCHYFYLKIKIS